MYFIQQTHKASRTYLNYYVKEGWLIKLITKKYKLPKIKQKKLPTCIEFNQ